MADYVLQIVVQGTDAASGPLQAAAGGVQEFAGAASGATGASEGFFSSIFKNAANIAALGGMLGGFASSIAGVASSLVSGNAQFEGYEARFASLMGSVDAAKAKIGELSQFASTTPFDLPGVVETSQKLQVFGGAALNTQENLTVVGNAAAASGQRIQDVGFWYARAYSSIQNGQPFGEAAQNLQQMGVMSGETAIKLTALQKSGADGTAVWQAFTQGLNAPTDAMQKMGQTWEGLSSTLADTWDGLVRTFSAPLFDALKPQMSNLINTLSSSGLQEAVGQLGEAFASVLGPAIDFVANDVIPAAVSAFEMIAPAVQSAVAVVSEIGAFFGELAGQAVAWGANIMDQFGAGIMASAQAVIDAVMSIGSIITEWLQPGSPPKITPNLDQWGTDAANVYMGGWGQADYSVFNSIGDGIKSALEGIAKASGDKNMNVAAMVLGDQANIAQAIDEVHTLGSVSEDTFNKIIAGAGPAGPQISGLVRSYLDLESATQNVARAQDELNNVTAEYSAKLDPLKGQLKDIQNQKQAIQDAQRLAKLQEEVANAGGDAAKKQLALLEIQEIQTRQQIRTTEADRDVAVGAAKAKLDAAKQQQTAAKAQVDTQKALLDSQNKTNALLAAQVKALGGAAGAHKAAAGAAAAHAKAQVDVHGPMAAVNTAMGQVGQTASAASAGVNQMASGMRDFLAPAITFVSANMNGIMGALTGIGTALASVWAITVAGPAIWAALGTALSAVGTALAFILSPIGLLIVASAALGAAISTNFMGIGTLAQNLMGIFGQFGAVIAQAFAAFQSGGISAALATFAAGLSGVGASLLAWTEQLGGVLLSIGQLILTNVLTWGAAFIGWVAPYVPIVLAELGTLLMSIGGWVVSQIPVLVAQLLAWGAAFIGWVAPYVPIVLAELGTLLVSIGGWVVSQIPVLVAQLLAWGAAFIAWVGPMIPPAIAALAGLASSFFAWIAAQAGPIIAQLGVWASALVAWIAPATVSFLAAWPGMLSGFLAWIAGAVGPILAQLGSWAIAFVSWILPMIPPFINNLTTLFVRMVAFVVQQIPGIIVAFVGIAAAILVWVGQTALVITGALISWGVALLGWVGKEVLPKLPGLLAGIVSAIISWIGTAATALAAGAMAVGKAIIDGIVKGIAGAAGALYDKIKSVASSAVSAFTGAIDSHSPSRVFAEQGGVPIVEGIAMGIKAASPKATTAMLDLAGKLVDVVSKGVDAFGKLNQLGTIPMSSIKRFADTLQSTMTTFGQMTLTWDKAMMSSASQFTAKSGAVVELMSKGVEFLTKLADLKAVAPASIRAFADGLEQALLEMVRISTRQTLIAMANAQAFAESASKIVGVIGAGVDAFKKLEGFTRPASAAMEQFSFAMSDAVGYVIRIANWFMGQPLGAASTFAETAGKIIAVIGTGVDAFKKLDGFVRPASASIEAFSFAMSDAVGYITRIAGWFAGYPVAAAATFAESAGKIIGIIGSGVDNLKKLGEFKAPASAAFAQFALAVSDAVGYLVQTAAQFSAQGVAAAAVFAESTGKIIGIIGSGVDGFTKLATFTGVPGKAIYEFNLALIGVVFEIDRTATYFASEAVAAGAKFAESAGKIVGILGAGVDGFTKLADFTGVPAKAIYEFNLALIGVVFEIDRTATYFAAEAVAAGAKFAEGAGKIVSILGAGVDGFTKLADFTGVPAKAIAAFGVALQATVIEISRVAQTFSAEAVAAAGVFAGGAGKAVGVIGAGVEGFIKLAEFKGIPAKAIGLFAAGLQATLLQIVALSGLWSQEALDAAARFATAVKSVVDTLKAALDAFKQLGDFSGVSKGALTAFTSGMGSLLGEMQRQTLPAAMFIGANIAIGIANGITSQAGAIQNAVYAAINQALAAARAALGIASPSKVFEQQIGVQMSAGMAKGVLGGMGDVQAAVGAVSGGALGAARSGGATTNNNQRSIVFQPGAIVVGGGGGSPQATADAVVSEINRRLGMQGT